MGVDVDVDVDVEVVEMPLILAAVTIWEAAVELMEVSTDQADVADVVDVDVVLDLAAAVQMTGALPVPCAQTVKEVSVPQSLARVVTLAVAQVLLSLVLSVLLSTTLPVNAARRRLHLDSVNGHVCGLAAAPALLQSLSSNL